MWTGHLMFNIKDVPVATGYTLVTLALVGTVSPTHGGQRCGWSGLFAGTVLMVGTRPAMASAVLGSVLILVVGLAVLRRPVRRVLAEVAVGLGAAAVLLVALYPGVYADPLRLLSSAEQSTSFRGGGGPARSTSRSTWSRSSRCSSRPARGLGSAWLPRLAYGRQNPGIPRARLVHQPPARSGSRSSSPRSRRSRSSGPHGLRPLQRAAPAAVRRAGVGVLVTLGLAHALAWARTRGRARLAGALAVVALVLRSPTRPRSSPTSTASGTPGSTPPAPA